MDDPDRTVVPRTGLALPGDTDRSGEWLVDYAVRASEAGFDSVWAPEAWGYDPFVLLGRTAARTECALGTCISNAFSRSPTALASSALALQEATDGQFVLGVGASTPSVVEDFHGQSFERPLRRIRELLEIVDLALSGDRIDYDGQIFELEGFRFQSVPDRSVPVFNAALGRTNMALSIDHADGIIPHLHPLSAIEEALADARERANRDREIHVAPSVPTAISEDPDEAERVLSDHVASYVGTTEVYRDVVARHGFETEAERIHAAWQDGRRGDAAAAVSRDLQEDVGIAGTPEYARDRFRDLLDGPADTVIVSFPRSITDDMYEAAVEVLPPEDV